MLQKPWFKLFIWFLATFFFFLASGAVISLLKPGPSEVDVMRYMSGMMAAMEKSIMGVMMGTESSSFRAVLIWTISSFPLGMILSIAIGFYLRKRNREDKNV